jgi:hypothetical protein
MASAGLRYDPIIGAFHDGAEYSSSITTVESTGNSVIDKMLRFK